MFKSEQIGLKDQESASNQDNHATEKNNYREKVISSYCKILTSKYFDVIKLALGKTNPKEDNLH